MATSQQGHDEDFIKRAQARLKNINERSEQLRNELHLPAEEKYALSSLIQEQEVSTGASIQVALPKGVSARRSRLSSIPVLAVSTAIVIGLLIFGLGLAITRVSGTNTAFATPLATLVTALILACIVSVQTQRGWNTLLPAWSNAHAYDKHSHYFSAVFNALPIYSTQPMPERKETSFTQPVRPAAKTRAKREELWKDKGVLLFVALALIAVSVASTFLNLVSPNQGHTSGNAVNIEPTGLSYGAVAFDIQRSDGGLKLQAAEKMKQSDTKGAVALWNQAIAKERDDAEAYIYSENARVLLSKQPHMTLVVGTLFTKGVTGLGRDNLQGAYIAQKEYNERVQKVGGKQLLLLIAVASDDPTSVTDIAKQIVSRTKTDSSILGVMGWPTSTSALAAVKVLDAAHIPMFSESATSDVLTGISPYFFRMGTDTQQASFGAKYVLNEMKEVKNVALVEDPANAYSKSLADAFFNTFTADGKHTVSRRFYTVKQPDSMKDMINTVIQDIDHGKIDMIYMSGYAADASTLLAALPSCESPSPCVQIMGGDALNTQGDYTTDKNLSRVHFTAFASAELWKKEGKQEPQFFSDYQDAFSAKKQLASKPISPDSDTMLSFDALSTLLHGCEQLQGGDQRDLQPEGLEKVLTNITFQGVSGLIHFDQQKNNGNAVDKAAVMLHIIDAHNIELDQQP